MTIDGQGNDVGLEGRIEDIKTRHGEDSWVFENTLKMAEHIRTII